MIHRKTRKVFNVPGDSHALTFSCQGRLPLLNSDHIKEAFLENLDKARRKHDFAVWAYVLMPEHVHLLVFPRQERYDISRFLLSIKKPVAVQAIEYLRHSDPQCLKQLQIRDSTGMTSYRFWLAGGGYDQNFRTPEENWNWIRYCHLNPVRRKLVLDPLEYPWSSARAYGGEENTVFKIDRYQGML